MRCFKYSICIFITTIFFVFNIYGASIPKKKEVKEEEIPPRAELTLYGSSMLYSILEPHIEKIEKKLNIQLHLISANSTQGIHALYNGDVDIAMVSSDPSSLAEKITEINVEKFLKFIVGDSRIVFIVNKNNPVKHAKDFELKWILSGKITNWKQLLGDDENILIAMEYHGSGIRNYVETEMLLRPIAIPVKSMVNAQQVVTVVSKIKHAVGITAEAFAKNKNVDIIEVKNETLVPFYFLCTHRTSEMKEGIEEVRKLNIGGNIEEYVKSEAASAVKDKDIEKKNEKEEAKQKALDKKDKPKH